MLSLLLCWRQQAVCLLKSGIALISAETNTWRKQHPSLCPTTQHQHVSLGKTCTYVIKEDLMQGTAPVLQEPDFQEHLTSQSRARQAQQAQARLLIPSAQSLSQLNPKTHGQIRHNRLSLWTQPKEVPVWAGQSGACDAAWRPSKLLPHWALASILRDAATPLLRCCKMHSTTVCSCWG